MRTFRELVERNRSYRRFDESVPVERGTLEELVDLARLSASSANRQPLRYRLCCDPETNGKVFPHLRWAGYLAGWEGPAPGERPVAYVVVLGDTRIARDFGSDQGIASAAIMLGAVEKGLGGCIVGSIDRDGLRRDLDLAEHFRILLVLALGKPVEAVVLEEAGPDDGIEYWRDADGVHHVPKRRLRDLIVG